MKNTKKHLKFITNIKLQEAVNHLDASDKLKDYEDKIDKFVKGEKKACELIQGADPFFYKLYSSTYSPEEWLRAEISRQLTKKVEQRIGEFHQKVLGNADGWIDLGVGGGMDICNDEKTIFIELKNKSNTVNDGSGKSVQKKCKEVAIKNPNATVYYGYVVHNHSSKGKKLWEIKNKQGKMEPIHKQLYKVWGSELYNIVTKDPLALDKTLKKLPELIKSIPEKKKLNVVINRIYEKLKPKIDDIEKILNEYFIDEKDPTIKPKKKAKGKKTKNKGMNKKTKVSKKQLLK